MLFWQPELIADLLKGYWLQQEDKYNPNPFFLPHTGDEWNPRGKFLLQQIGASPEEKLSQPDNLQTFFQAWKVDENRLFLNPNHSILYLLISLPKNKGHRKRVHNEPKLHLTGTKPGQNNFCQTSNIRKSNTRKRHFSFFPSAAVRPGVLSTAFWVKMQTKVKSAYPRRFWGKEYTAQRSSEKRYSFVVCFMFLLIYSPADKRGLGIIKVCHQHTCTIAQMKDLELCGKYPYC